MPKRGIRVDSRWPTCQSRLSAQRGRWAADKRRMAAALPLGFRKLHCHRKACGMSARPVLWSSCSVQSTGWKNSNCVLTRLPEAQRLSQPITLCAGPAARVRPFRLATLLTPNTNACRRFVIRPGVLLLRLVLQGTALLSECSAPRSARGSLRLLGQQPSMHCVSVYAAASGTLR